MPNIAPPPFPIIRDITGDAKVFVDVGWPQFKVHKYIGGPRTAEEPRIDTHILCWAMTETMPDYAIEQAYWYTTHQSQEVTCQTCLEWLHA